MLLNKPYKSGMTLTELLVASVLVGIVTMGLIAAEQAIRMSRQSSHRDLQVSTELQAAMSLLTHDANSTVGDPSSIGIYTLTSGGKKETVCFRSANGDPNTYNDDLWSCWVCKDDATDELINCRNLGAPTDCSLLAPNFVERWAKLSNTEFFSIIDSTGNELFPLPTPYLSGSLGYIELNLTSRFNLANPAHPIENPEYTITSRISPAGVSR